MNLIVPLFCLYLINDFEVENLRFSSIFNRFLFYPRFLTRRTLAAGLGR